MASAAEPIERRVLAARSASLAIGAVVCLASACSLDVSGHAPFDTVMLDLGTTPPPPALDATPTERDARARDAATTDMRLRDATPIDTTDVGPTPVDAAPRVDAAEDPDAGPPDSGPGEPDASPFCPSACDCEQSCSFGACDCSDGCACALSCTGGCSGKCDGDGSLCTLDAVGVGIFGFGCDHGATCTFNATASGAATFDCRHGSTCDVTCTATGPCTVRCREGSACTLRCPTGLCSLTDCPPMEFRDCGFGAYACNADCP